MPVAVKKASSKSAGLRQARHAQRVEATEQIALQSIIFPSGACPSPDVGGGLKEAARDRYTIEVAFFRSHF